MRTKLLTLAVCAAAAFIFISCETTGAASKAEPPAEKEPRVIEINGISIYEDMTDSGFTSWICTDASDQNLSPIEVGFFSEHETRYGYVSFDGGETATLAFFIREGLDLRWDYGLNNVFRIVIKPDGTTYLYDFTYALAGEITDEYQLYNAVKQ